MKGKLKQGYSLDNEHTLPIGTEVEIITGYCGTDGYYYVCELADGTQHIIGSDYITVTDYAPYIDWRTLRAKAAIAAMQGFCANSAVDITIDDMATLSIEQADALIKKLKEK